MQVNVDIISGKILPLLQKVSFSGMNLGDLSSGLSITFIVFGAFVLVLSAFGVFGVCCQNRFCLVIYVIIVSVFFVGKLVAVIMWFVMNNKLQSGLKTTLQSQLSSNYKSEDLKSHEIFYGHELPIYAVVLLRSDTRFGFQYRIEKSPWKASASASAKIPKFCCTGITASNYATATAPTSCTDSVSSGYHKTGCYDAVYNKLSSYTTGFIVVGVIVLVVEILAIIAAIVVSRKIGSDSMAV